MTKDFSKHICIGLIILVCSSLPVKSQVSRTARHWMNVLLEAIEKDGRGPTIHARNLFHLSAAMYDAWAVYDKRAQTWLLGQTRDGFHCPCVYDYKQVEGNIDSLREVAISYAAYRILSQRFDNFSGKVRTIDVIDDGMVATGLNKYTSSMDYQNGSAISLGNYLADCYIRYGLKDGSHDLDNYESFHYAPVNNFLSPNNKGNPGLSYPNRWQPLSMRDYIELRNGDPIIPNSNLLIAMGVQDFLSPEWGDVMPFALNAEDYRSAENETGEYKIYLDPGSPPILKQKIGSPDAGSYKWGFLLVALWSAHLDPADSVYWDISPGAIGNGPEIPKSFEDYGDYYNLIEGGTQNPNGYPQNPITKEPYAANVVLRGDYTRALAEFWADALNTSTPPGHWFRILNDVSDHPAFERKWTGLGKSIDELEWDVKSYFVLGGAMHDAAISAWSVKGFYDYVRPISAIRFLAGKGQCSNPKLTNYDAQGLPMIPGRIELVTRKDPLSGDHGEHIGKVKIFCWRGPDAIADFKNDQAGVGWILGENWWPYQRYSVPTPPFAGYVSGHSTFSMAAAEVLTQMTGSPFFPGGIAEYTIEKNAFLQFEKGPSTDITLQWATYFDAAAETSLSRIWGGIHPPADDLPGRLIGKEVGKRAFDFGSDFFRRK